jgi:hypothetical protein
VRPLQNAPFCSISALGSNFNPQNTQCIPACPVGPADRTGVVKIFAFLDLEQNWTFFKGLGVYPHSCDRIKLTSEIVAKHFNVFFFQIKAILYITQKIGFSRLNHFLFCCQIL